MGRVRISRLTFGAVLAVFLFAQPVMWGFVQTISDRLGVNQQWRFDLIISLAMLLILIASLAGRYRDAGWPASLALLQGVILLASALAAWWGFAGRLGVHQSGWHPNLSEGSGWYLILAFGGLAVGVVDLIALTLCGLLAKPVSQDKVVPDTAATQPSESAS